MPIFSWQRTWHINVWKMVGGTIPHWDFRGSLFVSGTMLKQSQRSRPVSREHANHFLSIVRHMNAEKRYHQCGQLTHFHCTIVRMDPPHLAGITCRTFPLRTCEKHRNVSLHEIYMVTNFEGRTAHRFRCTSLQASFLYIQYSGIIQ